MTSRLPRLAAGAMAEYINSSIFQKKEFLLVSICGSWPMQDSVVALAGEDKRKTKDTASMMDLMYLPLVPCLRLHCTVAQLVVLFMSTATHLLTLPTLKTKPN